MKMRQDCNQTILAEENAQLVTLIHLQGSKFFHLYMHRDMITTY